MTRPTLGEIKAAAEGAEVTDDGWFLNKTGDYVYADCDGQRVIIADAIDCTADARHIALCDPPTILALVEWAMKMRIRAEHLDDCAANPDWDGDDSTDPCNCGLDALLEGVEP